MLARRSVLVALLCGTSLAVRASAAETPPPESPPGPAASATAASDYDALAEIYRRLFLRVDGLVALDASRKDVLERRIVLAARTLDAAHTREPCILVEKARQAELDAAIVGAELGDGALPIVPAAGLHETIVPGSRRSAAAYVVPPGTVVQMLVLVPGARETDSDLASRTALEELASETGTLLIVPSLDGATSVQDVAARVGDAVDAFRRAFALAARVVYLGGVSNGASLQFEIPLLTHRHFAGYLAIAGTFPGARGGEILSNIRADGDALYFVAGGRDPEVPVAAVRASVSNCRSAGVFARYYERKDGVNSIASLAPAIGDAWRDMIHGIEGPQDDGLGSMPGEARPN